MDFSNLKPKVIKILNTQELSTAERLKEVCELLKSNIPHYDWVGFYFRNADKNELKLHAFAGEPTEHEIIPFGKGICGQVAISNENFVVPDINSQDNYISCNIDVKSEIVIPLFLKGENIGQIDIDSHQLNPFTGEDEGFLEFVNAEVAKVLDKDSLTSQVQKGN